MTGAHVATSGSRECALAAAVMAGPGLESCHLNSGGPSSRTRSERVKQSVLGSDDGPIHCPRVIRLGLAFDGARPVDTMERLLANSGFSSPEDLRSRFDIPTARLIGRALPARSRRLHVVAGSDEVLRQALMLGLCTALLYDPVRPVLWTDASLTRGLELFDPRGFYA